MIFGYAKMAITLVMIIGIGGAFTYVFKLRADNAVLKANNMVLEQSVESQKMVIEQQKKEKSNPHHQKIVQQRTN